jgi:hypothetical protein
MSFAQWVSILHDKSDEATRIIKHSLRWGENMATLTKSKRKQPRFMLSLKKGCVFYTCRGCKHRFHHLEFMMQHLRVCNAF